MATQKEPHEQSNNSLNISEQDTPQTGFWKYQAQARHFYHHKTIELLVAGLIVFNFCVGCLNRQIDPNGDRHSLLWSVFEDMFNILFFIELCVNMYGMWMRPFFRSKWNLFDLTVVSIGFLDLCRVPLPGPLKLVRLLRAFRVFRLFGRIESLKKTLEMIERAIPGVLSAFLIAVIMLCIYSVLATDFFKDIYGDCRDPLQVDPVAVTARGKCFGLDYYGNFGKSLYTLFQILTGESWSEAAVRPVLMYYETSPAEVAGVAFFFLSFIMINGIVIVNVVVAFLIDGMHAEPEKEEQEEDPKAPEAEECRDISLELKSIRQKLDYHSAEVKNQLRKIRERVEADSNNNGIQP